MVSKAIRAAIEVANPVFADEWREDKCKDDKEHDYGERDERKQGGQAEICILLSNDAHVRKLNSRWRGRDRPTNVLSFPQIEPFSTLAGMLGDIIIARETVVKEAQESSIDLGDHLLHLVVHGFVHILGHDHQNDTEAADMENMETEILKRLGIANPYDP